MARATVQDQVAALLEQTGERDPKLAIRAKVRELIEVYRTSFGDPEIPLRLDQFASLRGIGLSDEAPAFSPDAELVPDGRGGVVMRVNQDRPLTRRRFSIGHEITHTFFPGYEHKVQCRTDARHRDGSKAADMIESLCDVGASEFLFPFPWFPEDAGKVRTAEELLELAGRYKGSPEATIRRFAEISNENLAAVFFIWKLKPTQKREIGGPSLWGASPDEQTRDLLKLRVEYTIPSAAFQADCIFIPDDKSVENEGPIYEAASRNTCSDGEAVLDFGTLRGRCRVMAIPLYTRDEHRGPNGERAVVAVIEPVHLKRKSKKRHDVSGGFFGEAK